jgi:hypothetical protein
MGEQPVVTDCHSVADHRKEDRREREPEPREGLLNCSGKDDGRHQGWAQGDDRGEYQSVSRAVPWRRVSQARRHVFSHT